MGRGGRGKDFEEYVALYMEAFLGVTRIERNLPVKGKVADRPYDCDVHGIVESRGWRLVSGGSIALFLLGVGAIVIPEHLGDVGSTVQEAGRQVESALGPETAGWGIAILSVIAWVAALLGKKKARRHVWVECKERSKGSIKRTDINKLADAVADVCAFTGAKWRPDEMWLVSSTRFDIDALNFARERGVRCFEATEDETSETGVRLEERG